MNSFSENTENAIRAAERERAHRRRVVSERVAGVIGGLALALAVLLYVISTWIEYLLYEQMFAGMVAVGVPLALVLAVTFNALKFLLSWTIALGRSLTSWMTHTSRLALLTVSGFATFVVAADQTFDSRLNVLVDEQRTVIRSDFIEQERGVVARHRDALQSLREEFQRRERNVRAELEPDIAHYTECLKEQFHITDATGSPVGPLWRACEAQRDEFRNRLERNVQGVWQEHDLRADALGREHAGAMNQLAVQREERLAGVHAGSLTGTTEAQAPFMQSVMLVNDNLDINIQAVHVAIGFSLLIMLILELGAIALVTWVAGNIGRQLGWRPEPREDRSSEDDWS